MNVAIFSKYNHIFLNLSLQYFLFLCKHYYMTTEPILQTKANWFRIKKKIFPLFHSVTFLFKKVMDMTAMHYEVATLKTSRINLHKFQTSARVQTRPKIPQPCERQLLKLMWRPQCP